MRKRGARGKRGGDIACLECHSDGSAAFDAVLLTLDSAVFKYRGGELLSLVSHDLDVALPGAARGRVVVTR